MRQEIWYRNYKNLRLKVDELSDAFTKRCAELKIEKGKIIGEFTREFVSRAVHESNWQEGLELDEGKTQKMASIAFDDAEDIAGPHLDMKMVLDLHRRSVTKLKKTGSSIEEIGAYNLARAYHAVGWIGLELANRSTASLAFALKAAGEMLEQLTTAEAASNKVSQETLSRVESAYNLLEELTTDQSPVISPMTDACKTQGEMLIELLKLDHAELLHPMRISYIHFLHRISLSGIINQSALGTLRKTSVHVGNFDLFFPPPSALPRLMDEYCHNFPTLLPTLQNIKDPIIEAAKFSHRFVAIHPYEDGNGRVSRLIMNLILWGRFPPIYLKANKKGRHKYMLALKRADRGNIEPMASLIAMSIIEVYEKMLRSLGSSQDFS